MGETITCDLQIRPTGLRQPKHKNVILPNYSVESFCYLSPPFLMFPHWSNYNPLFDWVINQGDKMAGIQKLQELLQAGFSLAAKTQRSNHRFTPAIKYSVSYAGFDDLSIKV